MCHFLSGRDGAIRPRNPAKSEVPEVFFPFVWEGRNSGCGPKQWAGIRNHQSIIDVGSEYQLCDLELKNYSFVFLSCESATTNGCRRLFT
ncbi:hypothetical protein WG66_014254 [Moniliophthora roreri]|nr:hypothetical protein WG66_014254 [Moniliophthora roreri]